MATKISTVIMRKSSNPGVVPSAGQLQHAELAINTADRKLYSKDASGNVFQVAAEPGRGIGKALVLENLDGSGYPVLNSDDRRYHRRIGAIPGRYADHIFTNDPTLMSGGPTGGVDHVVLVTQTIDKKVNTYQWAFGSHLIVKGGAGGDPNGGAAGGGQHCGMNTQVFVEANCSVFGFNSNIVDSVAAPTAGRVGYEAGMGVLGPDPNKMRCVVSVAIGSNDLDPVTQIGTPGDNRVHKGVVIGPTNSDPTMAQFTNALLIEGRTKVGINLTRIDTSWGDAQIIAMPSGGDIVWTEDTEYLATPSPKMRIGYNAAPARRTLKITGVRRASGGNVAVGAQSDYLILDTETGPVAIPSFSISTIS